MKQLEQKRTRNPRTPEGIKQQIPDELVLLAEKTQDRIDKNFGEFMRKQPGPNIDMVRKLYPIITGPDYMSKLLSGDRHVKLPLLFVLHWVCGVDLNEFIAGDRAERPSITPEQVEALRAIVKMYDDFSENQGKSDNKSCQ